MGRTDTTVARAQLVDSEITPYYHRISRCVRRAFLYGGEDAHRKDWIENRLQELAGIFAIEVCGYAVLDNYLHVLVRLEPERATGWPDDDVVRRWGRLYPPRGKDRRHKGQKRAGMLAGFTLSSYLRLIDWTSRFHRTGKAHVSQEMALLLNRSGITAAVWRRTMERLHSRDCELGVVFCFRSIPIARGRCPSPVFSRRQHQRLPRLRLLKILILFVGGCPLTTVLRATPLHESSISSKSHHHHHPIEPPRQLAFHTPIVTVC